MGGSSPWPATSTGVLNKQASYISGSAENKEDINVVVQPQGIGVCCRKLSKFYALVIKMKFSEYRNQDSYLNL